MSASAIVEIITVGREILDGRVIDTNAVAIAEALRAVGLTPRHGQRVDDELNRIVESFQIAASRSQVVLVTGGLGPTSDDLTAQAFAKFLGEPLVMNPEALAQLEAFFAKFKRPLLDIQKKQALLPPSCFVLENTKGTAPGFGLETPQTSWYFMPGVPREMTVMLDEKIVPRLPKLKGYRSMTWATHFTTEAALQERLNPVEARMPTGFEMTYRTRFPENHVALYADCATPERQQHFDELCSEVTRLLGDDVFSTCRDGAPLPSLEEVVVSRLKQAKCGLVTVESCTGGQIATRITDIAGVSEIYWGSFVAYDYAAKETQVGIDPMELKLHGAVSPEIARALAKHGLQRMGESIDFAQIHAMPRPDRMLCVSTTGIAGPSGGTETKPVGLCYIGIATSDGKVMVEELRARLGLNRQLYRTYFTQKALDLVRRALMVPPNQRR